MNIGTLCNRKAVCSHSDATVADAARLMRAEKVGSVVVVSRRKPIGIITDRDIVVRVLAAGLSPQTSKLRDVLAWSVITVRQDQSVAEAVDLMHKHGVHRLPVVNAANALVGIVSASDALRYLATSVARLATLSARFSQKPFNGSGDTPANAQPTAHIATPSAP